MTTSDQTPEGVRRGVHPTLGLFDSEPVDDLTPPSPVDEDDVYATWIRSPWEAYLAHKAEEELCALVYKKWIAS